MFVAMTAVGLTTLALLTLDLQHSTGQHCSEGEREQIWSSLPQCQPRETLVALPLPRDPTILQVVPSHAVVAQCAGTCHDRNQGLYQRCVPGEVVNTSVPVLYERILPNTSLVEECGSVQVAEHITCRCGCPPMECGETQVFEERTCSCRCRDRGARGQCLVQYNKEWHADSCSCRCRPEEWKECSTGFRYDGEYSCQCLPYSNIASTSITVVLGAIVCVLIIVCVAFFVTLRRTREKLHKVTTEMKAGRLFPASEKEF